MNLNQSDKEKFDSEGVSWQNDNYVNAKDEKNQPIFIGLDGKVVNFKQENLSYTTQLSTSPAEFSTLLNELKKSVLQE